MPNAFDIALDQCLDRMLGQGASVEDCLALYPEHAGELEQALRAAAQLQAVRFTPSAAAKDRGRLKLRAELQALERASTQVTLHRRWSLWSTPHLRLAGALAGIVLLLLIGAPSLVAAASGSIPGDTLYPVKRGFEQTRLAFQFSEAGKAALHLNFAERRVDEIALLIEHGHAAGIAATRENLDAQLATASTLTANLKDERAAAELSSKVEAKAARVLARLQNSVIAAKAGAVRQAAQDSLHQASAASADSVEKALTRATPDASAKATGELALVLLDRRNITTPRIDSLTVTIDRIEARLAGDDDGRWTVLLDAPQTIDLADLSTNGLLLGSLALDRGSYKQLRVHVSAATAIVAGRAITLLTPREGFILKRPFRVQSGMATVLYLDIDAASSVGRKDGQPALEPKALLFAFEPGQPRNDLALATIRPTEAKHRPTTVATREPLRSLTSDSPLGTVDVQGNVQSLSSSSIVVGGTRFEVAPQAAVDATVKVGTEVRVRTVVQADGSLLAVEIQPKSAVRPAITLAPTPTPQRTTPTPRPQATPTIPLKPSPTAGPTARASPTPAPPPTPRPMRIRLEGIIEAVGIKTLTVSSVLVRISDHASIDGVLTIGAAVLIEGERQSDGSILALQLHVGAVRPTASPSPPRPTASATREAPSLPPIIPQTLPPTALSTPAPPLPTSAPLPPTPVVSPPATLLPTLLSTPIA